MFEDKHNNVITIGSVVQWYSRRYKSWIPGRVFEMVVRRNYITRLIEIKLRVEPIRSKLLKNERTTGYSLNRLMVLAKNVELLP